MTIFRPDSRLGPVTPRVRVGRFGGATCRGPFVSPVVDVEDGVLTSRRVENIL